MARLVEDPVFNIYVDPSCLSAPADDDTPKPLAKHSDGGSHNTDSLQDETDATEQPASNPKRLAAARDSLEARRLARASVDALSILNESHGNSLSLAANDSSVEDAPSPSLIKAAAAAEEDAAKVIAEIERKARETVTGRPTLPSRESALDSWITERSSDAGEDDADETIEVDLDAIISGDDGGESSSHGGADSDMFSNRSLRSSLASAGDIPKSPLLQSPTGSAKGPSPRVSAVSNISRISQYEEQEFVPASRPNPRLTHRTPSDVLARQLSSPTPSVNSGSRPRSGRRPSELTISRIPAPSRSVASPRSTVFEPSTSNLNSRSSTASRPSTGGSSISRTGLPAPTSPTLSPRPSNNSLVISKRNSQLFASPVTGSRPSTSGHGSSASPKPVFSSPLASPRPSATGSPASGTGSTKFPPPSQTVLPAVRDYSTPAKSSLARELETSSSAQSQPAELEEGYLVLLRVNMEPVRWMWADALNGLESFNRRCIAAGKAPFVPSDGLKSLHDTWDQLRDRVGALVVRRGILVDHPQEDYELLEERLLEALELPFHRRARILECGHYLGPSNVDEEFAESDDEFALAHTVDKRHWCKTCRAEIKYEGLGPERVFRVKVYATSGLMGPGAWATCWQEMERVDAEVVPIVEPAVLRELQSLGAAMKTEMDEKHCDLRSNLDSHFPTPQPRYVDTSPRLPSSMRAMHASPTGPLPSSPIRAAHFSPTTSPIRAAHFSPVTAQYPVAMDLSEERLRREADRLREIYGHSRVPSSAHSAASFTPSSPNVPSQPQTGPQSPPGPTPRSPSEEAYERRETRRRGNEYYRTASLPMLLFEAVRVLMRDRRNVAIMLLGFVALMLALRQAPPSTPPSLMPVHPYETPAVEEVVKQDAPVVDVQVSVPDIVEPAQVKSIPDVSSETPTIEKLITTSHLSKVDNASLDPVEALASAAMEMVDELEEEVVRVRKTVTETVKVSVTATETVTTHVPVVATHDEV